MSLSSKMSVVGSLIVKIIEKEKQQIKAYIFKYTFCLVMEISKSCKVSESL